jgi:hypothetical protein
MRGRIDRRDEREIRRQRRLAAADRRIGHDMAYWYEFGPLIVKGIALVVPTAAAAWVWFNVDHRVIGLVAGTTGLAMLFAYIASTIASTGPNARMMSRATGRRARPVWWHGVGAAGVLLVALAYVAMPLV